MTDVGKLREQHAAELEVAELEAELVVLKAAGDNPEGLRDVKNRLRELRVVYRLKREGWLIIGGGLERDPEYVPPTVAEGDAVVAPDAVNVKSKGRSPGGAA